MKAVITAGGRGTRLRPVTWTMNKHVIPIANEPMIFNAFRKIAETGIKDVAVIINEGDIDLPRICGDGSRWGISLTYIEQVGGPLGLANTLWQAKDFVGNDDVLLYLGDNIVLGSLSDLVNKFQNEHLDCCLALTRVDDPERFGVAEIDADGRITAVIEKPENPPNNLAVTGLYIYKGPSYFEAYEHIQPSDRGEYEISDIHDWFVKNGRTVGYEEMFGWWKDTGKPDDLLEGNQLLLNEMGLEDATIDEAATVHKDARIQGRVKIAAGAEIEQDVLIRGPVIIGANAKLENCYIGPHTTIGNNTVISDCEIEHSIVMDGAKISTNERITDSIIGHNATIVKQAASRPGGHKMVIGENTYLEL